MRFASQIHKTNGQALLISFSTTAAHLMASLQHYPYCHQPTRVRESERVKANASNKRGFSIGLLIKSFTTM